MHVCRFVFRAVLTGILLAASAMALAQAYPTRPIRLIISFPPGGSVDLTARALAQKLGESLGQQVLVDNRAGGNTILSADIAAHAPPDGYTLFMPLDSTLTQLPALYAKVPYDSLRDFAPISQINVTSYLFVTHPRTTFRTIGQLVLYAKANPGKLNFAASTALTQALTLMLKSAAGIDVTLVPYKGTQPMVQALLAGDVDVVVDGIPFYVSSIHAGKMAGLAISGSERSVQLPDTPTLREAGYPQLEARSWLAVFAPAGTPPAIVTRLNGEIVKALASPDLRERLINAGNTPVSSTPEALGAMLREDYTRWSGILKSLGIKLD